MNWIQTGEETVWMLLGVPTGSGVGWVVLGVAVFTLMLVFSRVSRLTNIPRSSGLVSLAAVALGLVLLVGIRVGLDGWLLPTLDVRLSGGIRTALTIVGSFVVMVPLICLSLKARVSSAMITWGGGVLAMVVVVVACRTALQVAEAGSEGAGRTKARSAEMQEFLNGE